MSSIWHPETLLDIQGTAGFPHGIQCHGRKGGDRDAPRCRWVKGSRDDERPDVEHARIVLRSMAAETPSEVTRETLQTLARLCLCRDWHAKPLQIRWVVEKWESALAGWQEAPQFSPSAVSTALSAELSAQVSDAEGSSWRSVPSQHLSARRDIATRRVSAPRQTTVAVARKDLAELPAQRDVAELPARRENSPESEDATLAPGGLEAWEATQQRLSALETENSQLRGTERRLRAEQAALEEALAAAEKKLSSLRLESKSLLKEKEQERRKLIDDLEQARAETSQSQAALDQILRNSGVLPKVDGDVAASAAKSDIACQAVPFNWEETRRDTGRVRSWARRVRGWLSLRRRGPLHM